LKNLVFQVNIKPNGVKTSGRKKFAYSNSLYDFSNQRAKDYADKVGADYFCLNNTDWLGNNYAPCYHKLYVYELLNKYEKVFYLDSDAIITKLCPDIFKYSKFSAVLDNAIHTPSGKKRLQRKLDIHNIKKQHDYFCSGVILFDKKFLQTTKQYWKDELDYWKDIKNGQHDQSTLNVLISKYYGKYNLLDADWGAHWKIGKFIKHYSGPTQTSEWTEEKFLSWEEKI
jgi:lipopolysaccharide biosynthesis glycosyltransferase